MEAYSQIPEHLRPHKEVNGRLFESSWMERLTRTSLWVPVVMHASIAIGFLYYVTTNVGLASKTVLILFIAGVMTWTLAEYWVHRFGYHCETDKKWLIKIQHLGHGIHHQHPKDEERLAMPPLPALFLISIFFGIFWLVGGLYATAFFPGFLIGYMMYIVLHYAQHRYRAPRFFPLKRLWKHHMLHHYKYPETKAFGVSTRLWDYVFDTMP